MIKWQGVLSTTEPINTVDLFKVRQGNTDEKFGFQILENGKINDLSGKTILFCTSFDSQLASGAHKIIQDEAEIVNPRQGQITYTMSQDAMHRPEDRQTGYFEIWAGEEHIATTQNFYYMIQPSVRDQLMDGSSHIHLLQKIIDALMSWSSDTQLDIEQWFETIKGLLGEDPAGELAISLLSLINKFDDFVLDNGISPEDFDGTDREKLQKAIDEAVLTNRSIRLTKMYDLTGESALMIDKSGAGRNKLYILGAGGGVIKNDSGTVFTAKVEDTGDIVVQNVRFKSTHGAGTVIFDCDKLIRLNLISNIFIDCDTVLYAPTRFLQTIKTNGNSIIGGKGWAYEFFRSYDTTISQDMIEHRDSAIGNITNGNDGNPANNTLRIQNCVIEGCGYNAIKLGSTFGCSISGNYMEAVKEGYIDLNLGNNSVYHNGLEISGNTMQLTTAQKEAGMPAIKISNLGNNGISSVGNVSTGILYEYGGNYGGTYGCIVSTGDISYSNKLIVNTNPNFTDRFINIGQKEKNRFGRIVNYEFKKEQVLVNAGGNILLQFKNSDLGGVTKDKKFIANYKIEGTGHSNFKVDYFSVNQSEPASGVDTANKISMLINNTGSQQYIIVTLYIMLIE